jgi:hypothetical protein
MRVALIASLVVSCAHNVRQDAATGPDGKETGAEPIELENGEGKATGIVTYPGGDRVDWKFVELPARVKGTLDVALSWMSPRPGLQIRFDLFDEWYRPVVPLQHGSSRHARSATIEKAASGTKYFIRVYAPNRGDAGTYRLAVAFHPEPKIDWQTVAIDDPPRLPGVPFNCDDSSFDPKRPECADFCPSTGAPANWRPCAKVCPTPPDASNVACWDVLCPNPPRMESKKCMENPPLHWPPCPDPSHPDLTNPLCPRTAPPPPPVMSRIVDLAKVANRTRVTISVGSDRGIDTTWKAELLAADSNTAVPGGEITIVRVMRTQCEGDVHLTPDQISQTHLRVRLLPPVR